MSSVGPVPVNAFREEAANVDLSEYPPWLALSFTAAIDAVCSVCFCSSWRETMGISPDSWFYPKVASVLVALRPLSLSYQDFVMQDSVSADEDGAAGWWISLRHLYRYVFQTNSTELSDLTTPAACLVVYCLFLIIQQIKRVLLPFYCSIGRKIGRKTHGPGWEHANEVRIEKFSEYLVCITCQFMIFPFGLWAIWGEDWMARGDDGLFNFVGTSHFFKGWPMHPVPPVMTWYYLLQAAYNVDALVWLCEMSFDVTLRSPIDLKRKWTLDTVLKSSHASFHSPIDIKWSKTVRKNFKEMAIHHLATVLLVYNSSCFRFTRIGCAVFVIHDISDMLLDLSKAANFVNTKAAIIVCYFLMCISWFVTRLYILPFVILRSVVLEGRLAMEYSLVTPETFKVYHGMFVFLLGSLVLLHSVWFVMFMRYWPIGTKEGVLRLVRMRERRKPARPEATS